MDELYDDRPSPENISRPIQLSRLHSEFEELEWLGKGGYGDVVKVRTMLFRIVVNYGFLPYIQWTVCASGTVFS